MSYLSTVDPPRQRILSRLSRCLSLTDTRLSGTLVSMSDNDLDLAYVAHALAHELVGHTVEFHASVPSTMPLARRLAMDPSVRSGAVVFAEEQTDGRGRLTRRWEAPYGQGLLLTVALKPPLLPTESAHLPMLAGVAIVDAMVDVAPALAGSVGLKWPNDVLLGVETPSMGKVAGILIEATFSGPSIEYALLGLGINVNQDSTMLPPAAKGGMPAASVSQHLGHHVDRAALAIALCQRLGQHLVACGHDGGEQLYLEWIRRLTTIGLQVTVCMTENGIALNGTAVNADRSGNLVVVDGEGQRHVFAAGDVTLQPQHATSAE